MRRVVPLAFVLVAAIAYAGTALATGGTSIANAPVVQPGVAVSGNTDGEATANGAIGSEVSAGCWSDLQYWRVKLTAGEKVTIVGKAISPAHNFGFGIFPAGTTDRTLAHASDFNAAFPGRAPIRFAATKSGWYPIVIGPTCYDASDGPYTFTVTVTR